MTDTLAAVRERDPSPADRELLDQLKATTARLAARALNASQPAGDAGSQQTLKDLEAKEEQLESAISDHNLEFRAVSREVTVEAVQSAIPPAPFFSSSRSIGRSTRTLRRTARHMVLVAMRPMSSVQAASRDGVDLGPTASSLDAAIDSLRQALRDPRRADVSQLSRAVDARAARTASRIDWERDPAAGVSRWSALNLVPFEALVDGRGKFAVERYAISYLTSGRDLAPHAGPTGRMAAAPSSFANPAFGVPSSPTGADSDPRSGSGTSATPKRDERLRNSGGTLLRADCRHRRGSAGDSCALSGCDAVHPRRGKQGGARARRRTAHSAHRHARILSPALRYSPRRIPFCDPASHSPGRIVTRVRRYSPRSKRRT